MRFRVFCGGNSLAVRPTDSRRLDGATARSFEGIRAPKKNHVSMWDTFEDPHFPSDLRHGLEGYIAGCDGGQEVGACFSIAGRKAWPAWLLPSTFESL